MRNGDLCVTEGGGVAKKDAKEDSRTEGPGGTCRREFRIQAFTLQYQRPSHFVTSQCLESQLYIAWVVFWAIFHLIITILQPFDVLQDSLPSPRWLAFLTNWGYLLLVTSSFLDCGLVLFAHLRQSDLLIDKSEMTWYLKLGWVLYNVSTVLSVTITLLFYTLLTPGTSPNSILKHAINSVYALSNFFICAKPFRILHAFHSMIFSFIYLIFSVIYQEITDDVIYEILDWTSLPTAPLLGIGTVIIVIPLVHVILFVLYRVRLLISKKANCNKVTIQTERGKESVQNEVLHAETTHM